MCIRDRTMTMPGFKLIACLALCAVAFSAPTASSFVEDTTLVQSESSMSKVNNLQRQFSQLQTSVGSKAYSELSRTSAVKDTIDDMIALVDKEIEPAINDAHKVDQEVLNTVFSQIRTYTHIVKGQKADLRVREARIRNWITEHNQKAAQWDKAGVRFMSTRDKWTRTHNKKTETCCARDNAAVVDVAYLKAYGRCDFKAPDADKCIEVVEKSVEAYTGGYFDRGLTHYNSLVSKCAQLVTDTQTTMNTFNKANAGCDKIEQQTRALADTIGEATRTFTKDWVATKNAYAIAIGKKENHFKRESARVSHDESDRKDEWSSTQIIKCMLVNYKAGGSFNDAGMAKCNKAAKKINHLVIEYPQLPTHITWSLKEFSALSRYTHPRTCHQVVTQENPMCKVRTQKPIPQCSNHLK
eukprot:TRINITY_DN4083_c0_g1_i2.p1 TRINITY_DN4083_c0_g1~~TRINITY_DN4083_c0_g1_i2.p1  ORF type:complete len:412 (+),score=146.92 TRINITY_DN4083_c0_g1_i2:131-1366(+)